MTMRTPGFLFVLIAIWLTSCLGEGTSVNGECVKGKYLGLYCEGVAVQILDGDSIGRDWFATYGDQHYKSSVVASIDTLLTKQGFNPSILNAEDSVFYFQYRKGGYARKQYNVCDPSPFITITFISRENCRQNERN